MSMSWDQMSENVQDRQPSGGKLNRLKDGPFIISILEVSKEDGEVLGCLNIHELIPLKPAPISGICYRVGIKEGSSAGADRVVRWMTGADEPFPDEDEYEG